MYVFNVKTIGFDELNKMLSQTEKKAHHVLFNVINRVVSNVRKNLSKEVIKKYSIKSSAVKDTLKWKKPSRDDLTSYIRTDGSTIPLYKFKVKPKDVPDFRGVKTSKRKKVKAKVLKSSSMKTLSGIFLAKMKSGHIGLFKNADGNLKEVHTLSIPQMVSNKEVMARIVKNAEETYNKRITHEIDRIYKGMY